MLKSMTGYGSSIKEPEGLLLKTEIKSTNSKSLDLKINLPVKFSFKEIEIYNLIKQKLDRGKVDIYVNLTHKNSDYTNKFINTELIRKYHADISKIADELKLSKENILSSLLTLPGVLSENGNLSGQDEKEYKQILESIMNAVDSLDESRKSEGDKLEKEIVKYIRKIDSIRSDIDTNRDDRIHKTKEKLKAHLESSETANIDKDRFEQELIYYLEKLDISEEMDRLKSHISYFIKTMDEENNGKKLNFISQELGREINTIGSKANDFQIQQKVVEMKDELEKIKQQLANVL